GVAGHGGNISGLSVARRGITRRGAGNGAARLDPAESQRQALALAGDGRDRAGHLDHGEPRPRLLPAIAVLRPAVDRRLVRRADHPYPVKPLSPPDLVLLAAMRDDRLLRHAASLHAHAR